MLDPFRILKYSERILELIDNQDDYPRSDVQGIVDAIVVTMMREIEAEEKAKK